MTRLGLAALACIALTACDGDQKLLGRFDSATCRDEGQPGTDCRNALPEVEVTAVLAIKASEKPAATLATSLPDKALTRYIDALVHFSKDAAALRRNLAEPLTTAEPPPAALVDASNFPGTIYLTAAYAGPFNPTDRIERLKITMQLENGDFVSWTGARTLYSDIKPGSIESVGKVSLSGSLDIKPPAPVPVSGGLTASTDRTRTEKLDVVQKVEDVTASVEPPDKLVISRRGGFGLDLAGNAQIDVVLSTTDRASASPILFRIVGYGPKTAPPAPPASLSVVGSETRIPLAGLTAQIQADYVIRHVVAGGGTSEEGDDTVEFVTRHTTPRNVVLTKPGAALWGLTSDTKRMRSNGLRFLATKTGRRPVLLCFASKSEADELLAYLKRLKAEPAALGATPIGLESGSQIEAGFGGLSVNPGCGL